MMPEEILEKRPQQSNKSLMWVIAVLLVLVIATGGYILVSRDSATKDESTTEQSVEADDSATEVVSSTADETADWKTYTNDTYGFSFKYPTVDTISSQGMLSDDTASPQQLVLDSASKIVLNVFYMPDSDYKSMGEYDSFQLPLKQFAQKYVDITRANKYVENNTVSELADKTIGAHTGYSFTTTKSFEGPWGGGMANDETHFFLENGINKLILTYPTTNITPAEKIISTFEFTQK